MLKKGGYTCVICKNDVCFTSKERGVAPLIKHLDKADNLKGFSAADKVVGRGAAFLYSALEVREVYAEVLSRPAKEVFDNFNIRYTFSTLTDAIKNRSGDGFCPIETAVMDISNTKDAIIAIKTKLKQLIKQ